MGVVWRIERHAVVGLLGADACDDRPRRDALDSCKQGVGRAQQRVHRLPLAVDDRFGQREVGPEREAVAVEEEEPLARRFGRRHRLDCTDGHRHAGASCGRIRLSRLVIGYHWDAPASMATAKELPTRAESNGKQERGRAGE